MKTGTKTKIFPAYTQGKPTYKKQKGAGVYFIYNKNKELEYIGFSASCLYKALYRHFQEWKDKRQQRFTYSKENCFVRIIQTTPSRAALLEKYLILKFKPPGGLIKYESYTDKEKEKCKEILTNLEVNNDDLEPAPF